MTVLAPPSNERLLVVAAHPDDLESWCGGTITQAVDQGCRVRLALVTSGDKGSSDPLTTPERIAAEREAEARRAADVLGIEAVDFWRYPDGEVENTNELRGRIVEVFRRWRPECVFTHDPVAPLPRYLCHRDHLAVGRATLDAVYPLARDVHYFPEHHRAGLMPHKVRRVWLFASGAADHYVDITAGIERKIAARLEHRSQTPDPAILPGNWRARAKRCGEPAGVPLAETFTLLELD
jgi:LmbE family N-acetylglucosaminyl deacetylase